MELNLKGKNNGIHDIIVSKCTFNPFKLSSNRQILIVSSFDNLGDLPLDISQFYIVTMEAVNLNQNGIYCIKSLDDLSEGDILLLTSEGLVKNLFRPNHKSNSLLVTDRCNSNCLMCSQPPKDINDIPSIRKIHNALIPQIPNETSVLGITGGEPTILGEYFIELLNNLKFHLPNTEVHILTNGRNFAYSNYVKKVSEIDTLNRFLFAVPLYSDFYQIHDYVVQSRNAYYQTVKGIQNLGRFGVRTEIRIVLHKIVLPRLKELCEFIFMNFPFVEHVAFMGMEVTGFARGNMDKLWVDPVEYQEVLSESIHYISSKNISASIYNLSLIHI